MSDGKGGGGDRADREVAKNSQGLIAAGENVSSSRKEGRKGKRGR
jgi:hypothetical protein